MNDQHEQDVETTETTGETPVTQDEVVVTESEVVTESTITEDVSPTPVNIEAEPAVVEVEAVSGDEMGYPKPRGAFLFVMLMMTFYILYWFISYIEIFVVRGR